MLMNNLDPEVAEDPDQLVVYGGTGRAARSWDAFDAIVRELRVLADDETLLVQSGKPVGVLRTHEWAPRVLIANSNLVGKWATWEHFRELERAGLMMYGQMTAGSWIYIGTQGILQGTYETFAEAARQHFGGTLRGTVTLTAGLGGMGGAQPLAVTMNEGVCLAIEVDEARARRRLEIGYVDLLTHDPAEALGWARERPREARPTSIALVGNAAEIEPAWAAAGERFDLVTDQTSAHDALAGYVPAEITLADALSLRDDPAGGVRAPLALPRWPTTCGPCSPSSGPGSIVFDYGNNLRAQANEAGVADAFDYPGFVPAFIRPQFCEGRGPFRWAALSGDPADIQRTDRAILELFPDDAGLRRWIEMAQARVPFQGLPARICWLGYGERARAGLAFNELVRTGEVAAPIVIGRDHLDAGRSRRPTARPRPWAMARTPSPTGRSSTPWSTPRRARRGCRSTTAAASASGTASMPAWSSSPTGRPLAAQKLERVLTTDPAMGVLRHVDAGYERAIEVARERGVRVPMLDSRPAQDSPGVHPVPTRTVRWCGPEWLHAVWYGTARYSDAIPKRHCFEEEDRPS